MRRLMNVLGACAVGVLVSVVVLSYADAPAWGAYGFATLTTLVVYVNLDRR